MTLNLHIRPELRRSPEFQSALVRLGMWTFSACYIGLGIGTDYLSVDLGKFVALFSIYFAAFGVLLWSVVRRPDWAARRYVALVLDITATSFAIFLTSHAISPFYLFYIWIFISAGTRYGRTHLIVASVASVVAYNVVLIALDEWGRHTFEAAFFLLLLVALPWYQHSLLRKVQAARAEAERANKAKGDFLANMTHELRTPLTGVIGMAQLLQSTELTGEQRDYVDAIDNSAQVLAGIIGDILDFSKIDAHMLVLESVPFDLRVTIQDVCGVLGTQALGKGLELLIRVDPAVPAKVLGDPLRVRQILFNLVGNAVKFTHQGGVTVQLGPWTGPLPAAQAGRGRRRTPEPEARPQLLLEVLDTGIGIPADKISQIFESFRQADDSTTRRYGGTGLGTSIARDLAGLMGGEIGVDSEEGQGSHFWVRLPLAAASVAEPIRPDLAQSLSGRNIAVYETTAATRALIRDACRYGGGDCRFLDDIGQLGTLATQAPAPDLLILADSPQGVDLGGVLTLMRRVFSPMPPCLLLTYAARRIGSGVEGYRTLSKPFLTRDLTEAMARALAPAAAGALGAHPAPPPAGAIAATRPDAGQIRILVAEDNDIAARVITTLLRKQGYAVDRVADGGAALELGQAQPFDLAIIDLRMPVLDGIAFTRAYRAAEGGRHLPIVALTANASEDLAVACREAGMDAFLAKPVKPAELAEVIARLVPTRGGVALEA